MKFTCLSFLIGVLALAGFPLTSCFFSKDEILANAFEVSPILWFAGIVTAALTAFYTFRAIFLTFHGQPQDHHLYDHAHESRAPITFALVILAILALLGGLLGLPKFIGFPHFMEEWLSPVLVTVGEHTAENEEHLSLATEWILLTTSALISIIGIGVAYFFYLARPAIPQNLA